MASRSEYAKEFIHPVERYKKAVIIDADTLLYHASWTGKDEEGNKKPEYTEEEYPIAVDVLNNMLFSLRELFFLRHFLYLHKLQLIYALFVDYLTRLYLLVQLILELFYIST